MPTPLDFMGNPPRLAPIVKQEILKLIGHYRKDMRRNDTESGWVSAEEILALINDNNADGIRIYYGRHKENDALYPDQLNVILVATKNSNAGSQATYKNSVDQLNEFKANGPVNSVIFNFPYEDYTKPGDYERMGVDAIPLCPQNCPDVKPL